MSSATKNGIDWKYLIKSTNSLSSETLREVSFSTSSRYLPYLFPITSENTVVLNRDSTKHSYEYADKFPTMIFFSKSYITADSIEDTTKGECVATINWRFGKALTKKGKTFFCHAICKCNSISSIKTIPGKSYFKWACCSILITISENKSKSAS